MVPFERALVSSYTPSIVTFPVSLRVSEIQRYWRFCAPARHFFPPTSTLPKISPCSPGIRWVAFGCWANCPCSQFPRFPTYVVLIHQRHGQTDRQTCDRNTVLCTKVHRAVKIGWLLTKLLKNPQEHFLTCNAHICTFTNEILNMPVAPRFLSILDMPKFFLGTIPQSLPLASPVTSYIDLYCYIFRNLISIISKLVCH